MSLDVARAQQRPFSNRRLAFAGALLVMCGVLCEATSAEDVVLLKPSGNSRSPKRIIGTVTEYTGRELFIRVDGGREQVISADRVEDVTTDYTQKHVDADVAFAENRFAEAEALYRQAIREESRQWVRREILAQIVWCLRYQNKHEQAAATFLLIVENDPTTQYVSAIPLAWTRLELGLPAERQATEWLRDDREPVAQLIAASWLLSGPAELRGEAVRTLEDLTRTRELRIAQLAETQRWRTQVVTADDRQIDRWRSILENMPQPLRAGPYHLLGQALARRGRHEEAALVHMRVPILYPRQRRLAAESLLAAADALRKNQQADEARICLRELLREYPDSTAAAAAKSQLQETTGG